MFLFQYQLTVAYKVIVKHCNLVFGKWIGRNGCGERSQLCLIGDSYAMPQMVKVEILKVRILAGRIDEPH